MIELVAIVLVVVTASTWTWVATPQVITAWISFARDLDPTVAPQHAVLFAPGSSRATTTQPVPGHP